MIRRVHYILIGGIFIFIALFAYFKSNYKSRLFLSTRNLKKINIKRNHEFQKIILVMFYCI
ncbi:hypothetical protein MXB_4185 [Myxobolus squamalis]|nr:hypothetical protein MXB_4185 [Myxobolus squamalis]